MKQIDGFKYKDFEIMEYRENLLLEEIRKYRASVIGDEKSILPYVCNDNGEYSEKKTWKFIDELIKCSEIYWQCVKQKEYDEWEEETNRGDSSWAKYMRLCIPYFTEEDKSYLSSFFYCVIRICEANPWRNAGNLRQSFKDFITFSENQYSDITELYKDVVIADCNNNHYSNMKGMHRAGMWFNLLFTDKMMTDVYFSEEFKKEQYRYLDADIRRDLERFNCKISECWEYYWQELKENNPSFTYTSYQDYSMENGMEKDHILESFVHKGKFLEQYKIFLNHQYDARLYVPGLEKGIYKEEADFFKLHKFFPKVIEGTIRIYTETYGISKIQNDDAFFTAMGLLRQGRKRLDDI